VREGRRRGQTIGGFVTPFSDLPSSSALGVICIQVSRAVRETRSHTHNLAKLAFASPACIILFRIRNSETKYEKALDLLISTSSRHIYKTSKLHHNKIILKLNDDTSKRICVKGQTEIANFITVSLHFLAEAAPGKFLTKIYSYTANFHGLKCDLKVN